MNQSKTPLMQQFDELKEKAGNALLLFRMGDFYELFGKDAVIASKILGIALTTRDKNKENPVPMAGVPHHSVDGYISTLLSQGYKVAIGEQMEAPNSSKGIVKRDIVRILSPAIRFEMEEESSPCLGTLIPNYTQKKKLEKDFTLALIEVGTGNLYLNFVQSQEQLIESLQTVQLKHFLNFAEKTPLAYLNIIKSTSNALIESLPENYLRVETARQLLEIQYENQSIKTFFETESSTLGSAILLKYILSSQKISHLLNLKPPKPLIHKKTLRLGATSIDHLDLLSTSDGRPNLFETITKDLAKIQTSMGARKLKSWIQSPEIDPDKIKSKQELIAEWATQKLPEKTLIPNLASINDIERILSRIATRHANPRDLFVLGKSLSHIKPIIRGLHDVQTKLSKELLSSLLSNWKKIEPLISQIKVQMREDSPVSSRDGKIFNLNVSPELDQMISLTENAENHLIKLEADERKKTGISNLKIKYNRVFGYFIEVTKSHLSKVPKDYVRKQSTVNSERFITDPLKKLEDEILSAQTKRKDLESHLFSEILDQAKIKIPEMGLSAELIAEIDAFQTLATLALQPNWNFPKIDTSQDLEIQKGRHPVVANKLGGHFIPNTMSLNSHDRRTLLITGPNMGGKSTIMRQTALIVLLGQMGSAVPAEKANWGVFESIYTRMGANDSIAQGQSTFMVEMSELAFLLHHANERSLIVLDEIGRGTSTYDGMSVAWSTLEWICQKIKARCLFATHYHELTDLSNEIDALCNVHMAVESEGKQGKLRFLYKLSEGRANESFGIQVAQMAGIPKMITQRAWQVLKSLEKNHFQFNRPDPNQLSLFGSNTKTPPEEKEPELDPALKEILDDLNQMDIDQITPLQALNKLSDLRSKAI